MHAFNLVVQSDEFRLFHEPQPVKRIILDAVSAFSVAIQSSLRAGLLAK